VSDAKAITIPDRPTIPKLARAASGCKACDLYKNATQTVFGEGPRSASVMLVGEQPGDREDVEGEPFVGPAGRILDQALEEAGVGRRDAYVTNVVKHFRWTPGRGKRRLHQKPNAEQIAACRPWLDAELRVVKPKVVVCLGATAAKALLGPKFRVTRQRGEFLEPDFAPLATATVHPSSILRIDDEAERREARRAFVRDLRKVAKRVST
jgi:uracil-DNA glycosylase family protein